MSSRELSLILRLKDEASKELQGFSGKIDGMKPTFTKMAAVGTAAFTGIAYAANKTTQEAVAAQEIFNKFDVVFGDVSDEAEKVAQNLKNNFGLAESSAKDLLAATGDMLTGFGMSGDMALDLAEKTNQLAVDLASFTNIEGGAERASKALTKALLGERESVKELGIAILEEDVKAKVEAMEAAGKFTDETERQKKAIATLEIAYSQSKNAIGDFARTQDSAANQQRVLAERLKELQQTIGEVLLPILEELLEKILPIITGTQEWIKENPELTKQIIVISAAIAALLAVLGSLGLALPLVITGITLLSGPIGLVIVAIGALIAVGVLLYKNWDTIREKTSIAWSQIKELVVGTIEKIKGITEEFVVFYIGLIATMFDIIVPNWEEKLTRIAEFLKYIFGYMKEAVQLFVDWFKWLWEELVGTIMSLTDILVGGLKAKINSILTILDPLISKLERVINLAKEIGGKVGGAVSGAVSSIKERGANILGIQDAIITPQGQVIQTDPSDYLIATKTPGALAGGGLVINIDKVIGSDRRAAESFANEIAKIIKHEVKY